MRRARSRLHSPREKLRLPGRGECRLYVHLFDAVDRTFAEFPDILPFVRTTRDGDALVLQAAGGALV